MTLQCGYFNYFYDDLRRFLGLSVMPVAPVKPSPVRLLSSSRICDGCWRVRPQVPDLIPVQLPKFPHVRCWDDYVVLPKGYTEPLLRGFRGRRWSNGRQPVPRVAILDIMLVVLKNSNRDYQFNNHCYH